MKETSATANGFSTVEILIAITIISLAIVSVISVILGVPSSLTGARLEYSAYKHLDELLDKTALAAKSDFDSITAVGTTTKGMYDFSLSLTLLSDETSIVATAYSSWKNTLGIEKFISLTRLLTDPNGASGNPCKGPISGKWTTPTIVAEYRISAGDLLPPDTPTDVYPVKDVVYGKGVLAITISDTLRTSSPTLFFYGINEETGELIPRTPSFDNAPVSRFGYSDIVQSKGYFYAANTFGSASQTTCGVNHNCDQIQVFSIDENGTPAFYSGLQLSTTSPPFAVSAGSVSAGAQSLASKGDYLYVGLKKTIAGSEFVIIDISDPAYPKWVGGASVGRSVNTIFIFGKYAYVGSDDNTRELLIYDVEDPTNPLLSGVWNAPGSIGFGYGTAISLRGKVLTLGRSYVGNAPELVTLSVEEIENPVLLGSVDTGTISHPTSITDIITRDTLTFSTRGTRFDVWDTSSPQYIRLHGEISLLPGSTVGTSMTCKNSTLFVGGYEKLSNEGRLFVIESI